MAIKFGLAQTANPTPTRVVNGMDLFTAIAGAITGYIGTAAYIPPNVTMILGSILGFLVMLAQILKRFFGVPTTEKRVDVEDVSAMDEPKKDN